MKNSSTKSWALPLSTTLLLSVMAMGAHAEKSEYWHSSNGAVVKSGTGTCVRSGTWTPAFATDECDPGLMPKKVAAAPVASAPVTKTDKIIVTADTLFDVDKSDIKPAGKYILDELVGKLEGNSRVVISTGFTSSPGTDDYNFKLSQRRSEAVKAYLISKGIAGSRIITVGKGEQEPVADNTTAEGRAENRRVEIEVMPTQK